MESRLEQIFNEDGNWDSSDMLYEVETFLKNGGEELNLKQYKSVRVFIKNNYSNFVRDAIGSGMIDKKESNQMGHDLTEYLRREHYRLLEKQNPTPSVVNREKKVGFFKKAKSLLSGFKSWEKRDKNMYDLERALYLGENIENESELVSRISLRGASQYKQESIERMIPKTIYQKSLTRLSDKLKKVPGFYKEVLECRV